VRICSFGISKSAPCAGAAPRVLVDANVEVAALGIRKSAERASELGREDLYRLQVSEVILLQAQDPGNFGWLYVDDFDGDGQRLPLNRFRGSHGR
jgi:hypothetical protein